MFCRKCGKPIPDGAQFCPYCGADQNYKEVYTRKKVDYNASKYSRTLALIFACIGFVAIGGIHRFYVGKIGTGVIWLLTGGLFGLGTLIDVICIASGTFTDADGKAITNWDWD